MGSVEMHRKEGLLSAQKLIGTRVENPKGEGLGRIEDLLIRADGGQVTGAVVSFGGVLSLGSKLFAFPWGALELDSLKKRVILPLDRKTLGSARGFEKDHPPDMSDWSWVAGVPAGATPTPVGAESGVQRSESPVRETAAAIPNQIDHWGVSWQSHGLNRS